MRRHRGRAQASRGHPLTAQRLAELLTGAGLPDGVLNGVTGGGAAGPALVEHPGVDKIAFTGSTATGAKVAAGGDRPYQADHDGTRRQERPGQVRTLRPEIAHGYLTLSLLIPLFGKLLVVDDVRMAVNKVRFPAPVPVPVGAKIRLAGRLPR
ncbi:aldehyde dehydrogenase family protein [Virgisporangium aurantiacum]|uniref:Aldehyde dehydrogenase domain-containing protein n=1 Tax=Virgisporangium aurantiacum TaxID=175570 RepID=A0A8J3ZHQ3_9ACTN|nr:aldehyde dehydrogenase family protein [Virgisporangium aurantiacum]GIJ64036.1 hypothetical protein Vau01_115520 [Virgisporangium aurantiacum]